VWVWVCFQCTHVGSFCVFTTFGSSKLWTSSVPPTKEELIGQSNATHLVGWLLVMAHACAHHT
jgi:hypothetical protein